MSDLLTVPRICERIGCSRWTWRRWVTAKTAPQPVPGLPGHPKWKRADIDRFVEGRVREGRNHFGSARHALSVRGQLA